MGAVNAGARMVQWLTYRPVPPEPLLRPACTIIGGPNGSGKSTTYGRLALRGRFINADNVARRLSPADPAAAALAAGREVLADLDHAIQARESFVYETTLSSRQSLELMRTAARNGYEVGLIFVGLQDADMNVSRVAQRVARGGHHIPEDIIRRRFEITLRQLPDAIRIAGGSMLFDNGDTTGPKLVLAVAGGAALLHDFDAAKPFHRRLAMAVAAALSIPVDTVLGERQAH